MPKNFQVTATKNEVVAAALPIQERRLPLSNLDLLLPPVDVGVFFCYENHHNGLSSGQMVRIVKKALSQSLVLFYAFAGELVKNGAGQPEILCDNRVDFVEASADVELKDLDFYNPDESVEGKLVPKRKRSVFTAQVTQLLCGGLVVACTFAHQVADAYSANMFLVSWAEMAQRKPPSHSPSFHRSLLLPRQPSKYDVSIDDMYIPISALPPPPPAHGDAALSRIYYIEADRITELQTIANAHTNATKRTKLEAFSAFLWKLLGVSRLGIVVDGRSRLITTGDDTSMTSYIGNVLSIPFGEKRVDELRERPYKSPEHDAEIVTILAYPINKISTDIINKCASGGESHSMTMDLLNTLSNYSWDAKAAIVFAGFAIKYGEFWLVKNLHTTDPLAKNIATLEDLPDILAHADDIRKHFDAVLDLLTIVLKVSYCVIDFKELPSMDESPEFKAAAAHIPTAVYWIIRSILVCTFTLLNLIGSGRKYITSTSESWEISSMTHKLRMILEHLQNQMRICKALIDKKKEEDAYLAFIRLIESAHIDNMKVLKAIVRSREDQRPLYDGSKRTNERLEVLRLKYVLLLISDLKLPQEELNVLHMIYNQNQMRHEYEVLWLPIVDPADHTSLHNPVFYDLRNNSMPWFSVDHYSLVEPVAIRYTKEVWKFSHKPMLVVLDPQGRASNLDALPMMWIWGSTAFPFTKTREVVLWSESQWNIELLADAIDMRIPDWMRENKVICLYGGEDIDWIRKFTLTARAVARELKVPLEMLYVGKRDPKERVRRCHEIIDREKLSHVFSVAEYYDYVWYFWVRLWSMWNSKRQIGMTVENDRIMKEIMDILTLDSSDEGWAVFSRGNYEITKGSGGKVLTVFQNYQKWGHMVDEAEKFVGVVDEQIRGVHPEHHCNRLILPGLAGYIPERVVCSECGKKMEKYVMYRCCTD